MNDTIDTIFDRWLIVYLEQGDSLAEARYKAFESTKIIIHAVQLEDDIRTKFDLKKEHIDSIDCPCSKCDGYAVDEYMANQREEWTH